MTEFVDPMLKKVGRPDVKESDAQAMDDILRDQKMIKTLLTQVERLGKDKEMHKQRGKALTEDIKLTAKDTFKLSAKKMNELITDWQSGKLKDRIAEKTSTVDMLEEFERLSEEG